MLDVARAAQRIELDGASAVGYFAGTSGSGAGLGPAQPYNVMVFGDFSAPHSDVEGRLAAAGDVAIDNYSVGR